MIIRSLILFALAGPAEIGGGYLMRKVMEFSRIAEWKPCRRVTLVRIELPEVE